ncbi:hypothetical protein IW261DRAFT_1609062 [Armillaria novae-zelandiae]|uniref:Uncharacterized protein n=1 Tax=Armillaria novae-zelandiae TaxID=153914 RepID=A0AA39P4C3_9AGAR|nr:hypothetical protein IW261DRAFT_1609062 [Armillaria novae-zelandiae]
MILSTSSIILYDLPSDMIKLYDTTSLLKVFESKTLTIGDGQEHYLVDLYNFATTPSNAFSGVSFDGIHFINPDPRTFSELYFECFLRLVCDRIVAFQFSEVTLLPHTGRIWSAGSLTFNNVTFLGLFRVECTESQLCGVILSLPYLKGIAASEISIPNYLERAGAIANLSGQHIPEEIKKDQTGPALQSLAVDLRNCCDGILLSLFASRESLVRTSALKTILAWASADKPFFCRASVVEAISILLEIASHQQLILCIGNLLPVMPDIPLPPLRIPVNKPLLTIICAIVLTEEYQTANSLEWFTATFNNVRHPTKIQSVQINVSIGATVSPWHKLPQHGDISIAKWSALDDALCRAEVCVGGLLIGVEQPAGPLWTTHINAVSQWLQKTCLPKARKKYPSTGLYFSMPPKAAVITQDSAEEHEDAKSEADEKIEEDEDLFWQGSSNEDLI